MSTPHRSTAPAPALRRTLLAAASAAAAAGLVLAGAPAASAHDELESSEPAAGATTATAPSAVRLVFSEAPLALGARVVVTGPDGVVSTGDPRLVDDAVEQDLGPDLPAGQYTVDWRVTSDDGHPVDGELTFTASAATGATASASATAAAAPSASSSPAAPAASPRTAPAAADTSSGSALPWVGGAAALVVVVGAAAALVLRRRTGTGGTAR